LPAICEIQRWEIRGVEKVRKGATFISTQFSQYFYMSQDFRYILRAINLCSSLYFLKDVSNDIKKDLSLFI
jgi:hypothetical protein